MQVNQALLDACQLDTLSILQRFVVAKDEGAMVMTLQLVLKEATQGTLDSQKAQPVKVMPINGVARMPTCQWRSYIVLGIYLHDLAILQTLTCQQTSTSFCDHGGLASVIHLFYKSWTFQAIF